MSKIASKNPNKDLIKMNACLTKRQIEYIDAEREKLGIGFAEMLRRVLDEFLRINKHDKIEF